MRHRVKKNRKREVQKSSSKVPLEERIALEREKLKKQYSTIFSAITAVPMHLVLPHLSMWLFDQCGIVQWIIDNANVQLKYFLLKEHLTLLENEHPHLLSITRWMYDHLGLNPQLNSQTPLQKYNVLEAMLKSQNRYPSFSQAVEASITPTQIIPNTTIAVVKHQLTEIISCYPENFDIRMYTWLSYHKWIAELSALLEVSEHTAEYAAIGLIFKLRMKTHIVMSTTWYSQVTKPLTCLCQGVSFLIKAGPVDRVVVNRACSRLLPPLPTADSTRASKERLLQRMTALSAKSESCIFLIKWMSRALLLYALINYMYTRLFPPLNYWQQVETSQSYIDSTYLSLIPPALYGLLKDCHSAYKRFSFANDVISQRGILETMTANITMAQTWDMRAANRSLAESSFSFYLKRKKTNQQGVTLTSYEVITTLRRVFEENNMTMPYHARDTLVVNADFSITDDQADHIRQAIDQHLENLCSLKTIIDTFPDNMPVTKCIIYRNKQYSLRVQTMVPIDVTAASISDIEQAMPQYEFTVQNFTLNIVGNSPISPEQFQCLRGNVISFWRPEPTYLESQSAPPTRPETTIHQRTSVSNVKKRNRKPIRLSDSSTEELKGETQTLQWGEFTYIADHPAESNTYPIRSASLPTGAARLFGAIMLDGVDPEIANAFLRVLQNETRIVGSTNQQGIKMCTLEGFGGYQYKIKLLGKYGMFRLYGKIKEYTTDNQEPATLIVFDKLAKHT